MKSGPLLLILFTCCSACAWIPYAVHPIAVGEVELDPATVHTIGLSLPVLAGDEDFEHRVVPLGRELKKGRLRVPGDGLAEPTDRLVRVERLRPQQHGALVEHVIGPEVRGPVRIAAAARELLHVHGPAHDHR